MFPRSNAFDCKDKKRMPQDELGGGGGDGRRLTWQRTGTKQNGEKKNKASKACTRTFIPSEDLMATSTACEQIG